MNFIDTAAIYGFGLSEELVGEAIKGRRREDIVIVSVYYEWQLITPMMGSSMANAPDNTRILVSSQVFRNEPF